MIEFKIKQPEGEPALPASEPFRSLLTPNGDPAVECYRTEQGMLIAFPHLADFEVAADGTCITGTPMPGVSQATLEHLYLSQVLPMALSRVRHLVMHASAAEVNGGAVLFVGSSGRGKSTLATAFARNGRRFLADDHLVLERDSDGYQALPSLPSVRLWRDSHERMVGSEAPIAPPLDYTPKARLLASADLPHCDEPRRLRAIYCLAEVGARSITFDRVDANEAVIFLTRQAFILDIEDRVFMRTLFERLSALTSAIPCYHLSYPRRYDALGGIVDRIAAHATTNQGQS